MKSIITKDSLIAIVLIPLLIISLVVVAHVDNIRKNEFYTLINNPTFEGKVIDMRVSRRGMFLSATRFTEYSLRILGEYLYDDETFQVDRFFVVSEYVYYQFNKGDSINWQSISE